MHDRDDAVLLALRDAVAAALPGAEVQGSAAGGGHFSLTVVSPRFAGLGMVEAHRLVYAAIAHLMAGDAAPVHAIDVLRTRAS